MPIRRITAYLIDWCLFALWGGTVFLAVALLQSGEPAWPSNPWLGQAIGFLLTTLPFGGYFALMESSARQATLGKRALGLRVTTADGMRPTGQTALLRTVGKLLPWELAHTAVHQLSAADRSQMGSPPWAMALAFAAIAAAVVYVACLFTPSHRTPYDRWSKTRVVYSGSHELRRVM